MGVAKPNANQSRLFEHQIKNARIFFEIQLSELFLSEVSIKFQTLEELERSLERVNDAIQNPTSFGTLAIKTTDDSPYLISKPETQIEIGILPLLLERKKLILDHLDSKKDELRSNLDPGSVIPQPDNAIIVVPTFPIPNPTKMQQYQCDVFVIMPFADDFLAVYTDVVKPVGDNLGLEVKRGDNFFANNYIMDEVWFGIYYSKLVVADCTGRNPNVFYELGIAHTLGKPAILLTQNVDDIPFDVAGRRFIEYQDKLSSLKKMKGDLEVAIKVIISKAS